MWSKIGVGKMKNYYFEESGHYKIRKYIDADNKEGAIEDYEDWLNEEFYSGYIELESKDREVTEVEE